MYPQVKAWMKFLFQNIFAKSAESITFAALYKQDSFFNQTLLKSSIK